MNRSDYECATGGPCKAANKADCDHACMNRVQPVSFPEQSARVLTLADSLADLAGEARPQCPTPHECSAHGLCQENGCNAAAPAPVAQGEPAGCIDPMCACRGGPAVACPDGEREKELADLRDSLAFYKRRADALQQAQKRMRDPERTMVCDILANGCLLTPEGERYAAPAPVAQLTMPEGWVPLTITWETGYPEDVAYGPQRMMDRLKKWLDKHFAARIPDARAPAPVLTPAQVDQIVREVGELPDRESPEDCPEMMLVTASELRAIIEATGQEGGKDHG